ncbi:hypothetical protein [Roseofilum casamattae]|uniref:Uncharacterized protein n=1 Tax=Roseofilum casamattae BLCC-M143 TaxID=3022442 RepID=A0ABT7BXS2_9CYAN|nr:hypothetical protein [Roseofilum casamattae]MDJ1183988.1 hypothetical protein [Roseofilum casamattae BLCC-M143]
MPDSIIQLLDELPSDNLTVKMLKALDYVVPGEWENVVGCDRTITVVTGESDANKITAIRNRAIELYNDRDNGYQRAIWFYQTIDSADRALGAAALANKVGEKVKLLGFLNKLTPKADTIQSVDLCLKLVVELLAYSKLNGLPVLQPQQFVSEITNHYQGEALMRMATLVCVDGLLPLGPDFLQKVHAALDNGGNSSFQNNAAFKAIANFIPDDDKLGFITNTFDSVEGWMTNLIGSVGLTPKGIFDHIGGFIDFSDDSLDMVAAFIDQSTDYYQHTGIQSVARKLFLQAASEV